VRSDNYIVGASMGFDLLKSRPGGLRLGVMYMQGEIASLPDFNTGQVPDAQEDRAYGIKVLASTPNERLRGSLELARSRYTNPEDPLISQGLAVVPVKAETSWARDLSVAFDLPSGASARDQAPTSPP
jgi:hypothetical protein